MTCGKSGRDLWFEFEQIDRKAARLNERLQRGPTERIERERQTAGAEWRAGRDAWQQHLREPVAFEVFVKTLAL